MRVHSINTAAPARGFELSFHLSGDVVSAAPCVTAISSCQRFDPSKLQSPDAPIPVRRAARTLRDNPAAISPALQLRGCGREPSFDSGGGYPPRSERAACHPELRIPSALG